MSEDRHADYYDQIDELVDEAFQLPISSARTALLEEAVRIADLTQDDELRFSVRRHFIEEAFDSGEADKLLVALSWCIAVSNRDPDRFPPGELIDPMSEGLAYIACFPSITREQMETLLDDFEEKHRQSGESLRGVYRRRCFNAFWLGDRARAKEYFQTMALHPPDGWGIWDQLFRTDYYIHMNELENAYEEARQVLEGGYYEGGPYIWIAAYMLLPLVQMGKLDAAAEAHQRGYPGIRRNSKYIELVAYHICYLAAIRNLSRGLKLMERHMSWGFENASVRSRFEYLLACWILLRRLQLDGEQEIVLKLPKKCPLSGSDSPYRVADLAEFFESTVRELEEKFNARNGNRYFSEIIQKRMQLVLDTK